MKQKILTWANKHLSFAGRVQLIQSTLIGLRNYWMRVFLLPQSVIKEIKKLCRKFLWGLKDNQPKIHLSSWEKVCLPKALGGLGFKDGTLWNKASLARRFTRTFSPEICLASFKLLLRMTVVLFVEHIWSAISTYSLNVGCQEWCLLICLCGWGSKAGRSVLTAGIAGCVLLR
uniref:Reverse transcriptase n=1 Tax=Cannabis sativa TaxID=3483 RepID=A0A803QB66_CANSA